MLGFGAKTDLHFTENSPRFMTSLYYGRFTTNPGGLTNNFFLQIYKIPWVVNDAKGEVVDMKRKPGRFAVFREMKAKSRNSGVAGFG